MPPSQLLKKFASHPRQHDLAIALREIGRQGEIRDRTAEGQHYRMAGLNLLAATIISWNTDQLDKAVAQRKRAGLDCSPHLLAHISPLIFSLQASTDGRNGDAGKLMIRFRPLPDSTPHTKFARTLLEGWYYVRRIVYTKR